MMSKLKSKRGVAALAALLLAIGLAVGGCASGGSSAPPPSSSSGVTASRATGSTTTTPGVGSGYIQGLEQANTQGQANKENIFNFGKQEVASLPGGPSQEMENDAARNRTLDNPNRIGYLYIYSAYGTLLYSSTVKGKVSSTASELTNTSDIVDDYNCNNYQSGNCAVAVDSIGDDGTYGGEECGQNGIFWFTPSNQYESVCIGGAIPFYSDAPMNLTTKPLLTLPISTKVTSGAVPRNLAGVSTTQVSAKGHK